ncbi:MAG: molybdopterin molybdotransferase MoeA [Nocardioides sp.]
MAWPTGTRTRRGAHGWVEARNDAFAAGLAGSQHLGVEEVALAEALGRVLGDRVTALVDLPGFDASAMDGFAVCGAGPWRVLDGTGSRPGAPYGRPLPAGCAVPISTGAVVPSGTARVLPIEVCVVVGDYIEALEVAGRDHIRRRGSETALGQLIASPGSRVGAGLLGFAAASGHDRLVVRRRPTVKILLTGTEIIDRGTPAADQVRDAVGPMLAPMVAAAGGLVVSTTHLDDEVTLGLDSEEVDVVVVVGSTSVGVTDRLRHEIRATQRTVDGVHVRPGHPMLLGHIAGRPVVGLPGNPAAALVGAHTLLVPLLAGLSSGSLDPLPAIRLAAGRGTRAVPVRETSQGWQACPGHSAASLQGIAFATGLAVVGPSGDGVLVRL